MTNVSGARTSDSILQAKRVIDMSNQIAMLDPDIAPFVTILKRTKSNGGIRVANSKKIEWLEDDYLANSGTVNGEIASNVTTLVLTDGSFCRAGDILNVPSTGENLYVSAVSGNSLTIERSYGATAADTIATAVTVVRVGNANPENADVRDRASTQETAKYNYTQIIRNPIELSRTLMNSDTYGGGDLADQRRKVLAEHKEDIANALYFGQKVADTVTGATMGGLIEFISGGDNVQAFASGGTTCTYKNFITNVAKVVFKHGSREKLMIVGGTAAAAIASWDIDKLYTRVEEDTFGVIVNTLKTPFGNLQVVYDPLLDVDAIYSGYGIIVDMKKVKYAHLKNGDTMLLKDRQGNGVDGIIDEYLTECSLELRNPNAHMLCTGMYVPADA